MKKFIYFSFVTVNIDFPQLFIEIKENASPTNALNTVSYMCKDLRHRCKWIPIEYDVRAYKMF